jgi:predicted short-subunit dehydrogenase-like oxidoreductase (DUF2520 family)
MKILTYAELAAEVAAFHSAAEAERNAPVAVAVRALETLRAALAEMTADERHDIVDELCTLVDDATDDAWAALVAGEG